MCRRSVRKVEEGGKYEGKRGGNMREIWLAPFELCLSSPPQSRKFLSKTLSKMIFYSSKP
jgi:hypothetical protein